MSCKKQILYTISRDPEVGECIVPRVAERDEEGSLRLHRTKVALKHVANLDLSLVDADHAILKILDELNPEQLVRAFSKPKISLGELLETKTDRFRKEMFRPYIEKRLHRVLRLCGDHNSPLYLLNTRGSLIQTPLVPSDDRAAVRYHFRWSPEGMVYALQAHLREEILSLTDPDTLVLCDQPGILIHQNRIIPIDGVNGNKLRPFLKKEQLPIPQTTEKKYFHTFIRRLVAMNDDSHPPSGGV